MEIFRFRSQNVPYAGVWMSPERSDTLNHGAALAPRYYIYTIFLQIAAAATGNFPAIDSAVKRRRCDQKYIVMRGAEIPSVSSAHGDQSVLRLLNVKLFFLFLVTSNVGVACYSRGRTFLPPCDEYITLVWPPCLIVLISSTCSLLTYLCLLLQVRRPSKYFEGRGLPKKTKKNKKPVKDNRLCVFYCGG